MFSVFSMLKPSTGSSSSTSSHPKSGTPRRVGGVGRDLKDADCDCGKTFHDGAVFGWGIDLGLKGQYLMITQIWKKK